MDKLTFIEKIVSSLAWPLVVLAIAIIFRVSLSNLIRRITRLKAKGLDVTLVEAKEKILEAGQDLPEPKRITVFPASKEVHETKLKISAGEIERVSPSPVNVAVKPFDLAAKTPRQIIENAWQRLENTLRELGQSKLGHPPKKFPSLLVALDKLETVPPEIIYSIRGLETARNDLKKTTKPIGRGVAASFAHTVDRIIVFLQEEEFQE
jgi:hypothetical protein